MKEDIYLKQAVRDHFEGVQLDEQQIQQLDALGKARPGKINRRGILTWAMAASVLVATLLISMQYFNNKVVLSQIAAEIAENHLRLDKVEYQSDQFHSVAQHFDKLNFTPSLPGNIDDLDNRKLLGGRYCSIHGSIALQLRYGENILDSSTLFIASPKSGVRGELKNQLSHYNNRYETRIDDVDVQLWYEQGLLYAVSQKSN